MHFDTNFFLLVHWLSLLWVWSFSKETDMQAATSHVRRGEAKSEATIEGTKNSHTLTNKKNQEDPDKNSDNQFSEKLQSKSPK